MKFIYSIVLISALSTGSFSMAKSIEECEGSNDREKCYAEVLEQKLNIILRKIGSGGGSEPLQTITFYWKKDCTQEMGSGFVPTVLTSGNLASAEEACKKVADVVAQYPSNGNTDSYKLSSGRCVELNPVIEKGNKVAIANICLKSLVP